MKILFTILLLCCLGNLTISAQSLDLTGEAPAANQAVVQSECRQLKRTLNLDDNQYEKIVEIKSEWHKQLQVVNLLYPMQPEIREAKIEELEVQYDGELAKIFTDHQFEKYLELVGRPQTEETAETLPKIAKKPEGPTFNEKIQHILQEATKPKPDTALIALQEKHAKDSIRIALQAHQQDSVRLALQELGGQDTILISASPAIPANTLSADPAQLFDTSGKEIQPADADPASLAGTDTKKEAQPADDDLLILPVRLQTDDDQISLINSGDLGETPQIARQKPLLPAGEHFKNENLTPKPEQSIQNQGSIKEPAEDNQLKQPDQNGDLPEDPEPQTSPGSKTDQLADLLNDW